MLILRLHSEFKTLHINLTSQIILKLYHAGGLKPRDVPSGTSNLVSAVRRRHGQINFLILISIYSIQTNRFFTPFSAHNKKHKPLPIFQTMACTNIKIKNALHRLHQWSRKNIPRL